MRLSRAVVWLWLGPPPRPVSAPGSTGRGALWSAAQTCRFDRGPRHSEPARRRNVADLTAFWGRRSRTRVWGALRGHRRYQDPVLPWYALQRGRPDLLAVANRQMPWVTVVTSGRGRAERRRGRGLVKSGLELLWPATACQTDATAVSRCHGTPFGRARAGHSCLDGEREKAARRGITLRHARLGRCDQRRQAPQPVRIPFLAKRRLVGVWSWPWRLGDHSLGAASGPGPQCQSLGVSSEPRAAVCWPVGAGAKEAGQQPGPPSCLTPDAE